MSIKINFFFSPGHSRYRLNQDLSTPMSADSPTQTDINQSIKNLYKTPHSPEIENTESEEKFLYFFEKNIWIFESKRIPLQSHFGKVPVLG